VVVVSLVPSARILAGALATSIAVIPTAVRLPTPRLKVVFVSTLFPTLRSPVLAWTSLNPVVFGPAVLVPIPKPIAWKQNKSGPGLFLDFIAGRWGRHTDIDTDVELRLSR
jgi:hypothetical protein